MSAELDPFLEAILAQPDMLTPRRVFADYLEEQGDPRATFLRWSAAIQEQASLLPLPSRGCRTLHLAPLFHDPAKLRIFACLCVRLTPWQERELLGLRSRLHRVWEWLMPSAQSAIAASELFAAGLFTVHRLHRSLRDIRGLAAKPRQAALEQAMNTATDAVRFAATESPESLGLAATSALTAIFWKGQGSNPAHATQIMAQARAFQQSLVHLVAETPLER
jgi:uncharacterized protein (TIGR02996 family)